ATFNATLKTAGNQTITATDTASGGITPPITGTSNTITVSSTRTLAAVGVDPPSGSGVSQGFTFTFSDSDGRQNLDVLNVLINNFLDGQHACYLAYSRPLNVLYLVNDAGTGLLQGLVLDGSGGSVSNSQC